MAVRALAVSTAFALVFLSTAPTLAKGIVPPRGYVVVDGPGLAHPIVFSAPWDPSPTEGYYGEEAEIFMNFTLEPAELTPPSHRPPVSLGVGLLYIPSLALLVYAARRTPTAVAGGDRAV
ncbi:MAG: hypothetical protein ACRDHO_01435 [Actinomycetota bacterium]